MSRRYFGTDGVRGPYGGPVVNEAFFARLACAAGEWVKEQGAGRRESGGPAAPGAGVAGQRVLIGRDTRVSGESLVRAVVAGLRVAGMEPVDLGVLPTPAVARAVKVEGALLGVVLTASHNPAGDNGIKFFKRGGLKLSDEEEEQIETLLANVAERVSVSSLVDEGETLTPTAPDVASEYIAAMKRLLPADALRGWHVVLDTANGATLLTSRLALAGLGAEIQNVGIDSSLVQARAETIKKALVAAKESEMFYAVYGSVINDGCGSEHPELMCAAVRTMGARLGIAHDGDGDRCVLCDERGDVLDGDEILTLLALHALAEGRLAANTLVVTVQSNLGVDAAVAAAGGRVVRTPVGDRHVAERMRAEGATLGGESSGRIICADVSPTGDGLVAALRVIGVMRATGRPLSELRHGLKKFPQASTTVTVAAGAPKPPLESLPALTAAIRALEAELGARGRVLARWSGTEPKLRLLVEGPEDAVVRAGLAGLLAAAQRDLGVS